MRTSRTIVLLMAVTAVATRRPALIVLCGAVLLAFCEAVFRDLAPYGLFGTMSGELYFRRGELPWVGLLVSILLSATFLYASTRNIARQDF